MRSVGELLEGLRALWGEGLGWELDETEQPHEAGILRLDSSRARRYLGWSPRWNLEEALRNTVEWYRAYAEGGADLRELTLDHIKSFELGDPA